MSINNRQPAHLEMRGGKSKRQRIWEKIRQLQTFSLRTLVRELPGDIHADTTRTYVKALLNGGYLARAANDYRLIKDNGVECPRIRQDGSEVTQGRAQENLWQTLRRNRNPLTLNELVALASTDSVPVSPVAARDYLLNLGKAGYLQRTARTYLLHPAMNTGPRPPMVQRVRQVYDPNTGRVMWNEDSNDE